MIDYNGTLFIVVFGQGLDFTSKMNKGIINTNQCISFGVQCIDKPTDPTRKLVFYSNNVLLPPCMRGTNCLTGFFCPSDNKLRHFPWVFMSYESSWYPSNVTCPSILDMYQTIKEEAEPVGSRFTQTLYISNEALKLVWTCPISMLEW